VNKFRKNVKEKIEMKKFVVSIFLLLVLFVSVPAFAVVTQPTESVPATAIKINPPANNVGCPMMQGGAGMMNGNSQMMQGGAGMMNGGCPMMQGGKVLMTNNPQNGNRFFKNFRSNQENEECFNRGPKAIRWIVMGIKFLVCLLFWALLIILLVMLIKWALNPHRMMHCCRHNSSLDILNERLAKGEITAEQYDELKTKLS
jgi:hypothetical protein